jgi:thiol-disulfide isomerase/thioredoxin
LAFTNLENKATNSIEGFRGSYLLMDFWSPYCDECEKATPKIQRLAGIIARKGKVKLLSLKSSGSGPVERMPEVIPDGLTWINGQLKHQEETSIRTSLGVWNSQHFVLLDADGRFVFSGTFAQLVKKLDELDLK